MGTRWIWGVIYFLVFPWIKVGEPKPRWLPFLAGRLGRGQGDHMVKDLGYRFKEVVRLIVGG